MHVIITHTPSTTRKASHSRSRSLCLARTHTNHESHNNTYGNIELDNGLLHANCDLLVPRCTRHNLGHHGRMGSASFNKPLHAQTNGAHAYTRTHYTPELINYT